MEELEVFQKFDEIAVVTQYGDLFGGDKEKAKQIAAHKAWLQSIQDITVVCVSGFSDYQDQCKFCEERGLVIV